MRGINIRKIVKSVRNHFTGNNELTLTTRFNGVSKFSPIILGGFFLCTILIFVFGPLNWPVKNPFTLYAFLFLCLVALIFGYSIAVLKTKTYQAVININIERLLIFGAIVFLLCNIPTVYVTTGKLYPDVYTGITNTGLAYRYNKYYNLTMSPIPLYIRMLLSPFMFFVTPITIYFTFKLSIKGKILGVLVIVLTVFLGIAQSVNKMLLILLHSLFFS